MIPMVDLKWQHEQIKEALEPKLAKLFEKCDFVRGEAIAEFEESFARFTESKYCLSCDSGTGALELIIHSLSIPKESDIIVPVNTFYATAAAVVHMGHRPVFVDCNEHYLIDVNKVEEAITSRTRAIIAVHLYGQMADMKRLKEIAHKHGLFLIEDAAQAHGALQNGEAVGDHSYATAYSFFPGKNLGAYGDGGAITTNNKRAYQIMKQMAWFGCGKKNVHEYLGTNSKLDTFQAIVLNEKLKRLRKWNSLRRNISDFYTMALGGSSLLNIKLPPTAWHNIRGHVYHLYVIQVNKRDKLIKDSPDIGFGIHYPTPLHIQPAFKVLALKRKHEGYKDEFPVAEAAMGRIVSLPIHPGLSKESQKTIIERVKNHV